MRASRRGTQEEVGSELHHSRSSLSSKPRLRQALRLCEVQPQSDQEEEGAYDSQLEIQAPCPQECAKEITDEEGRAECNLEQLKGPVERRKEQGDEYGPYTGTCFSSTRQSDIEHMVAASEAHDSGLCAADRATRRRFARDLRNLTLASPQVNRHQKSGKDAAEWIPDRIRCWFAGRVLDVKLAFGLTVDRREAAALERILRGCANTAMEPMVCRAAPMAQGDTGRGTGGDGVLARYDDNRNGRITCKEARRHGIAPVPRAHPAYRYMRDGDGDGVVCE